MSDGRDPLAGRQQFQATQQSQASVEACCGQPGTSMTVVALAKGINFNLLHRRAIDQPSRVRGTTPASPRKGFVALSLPAPVPPVSAASDSESPFVAAR